MSRAASQRLWQAAPAAMAEGELTHRTKYTLWLAAVKSGNGRSYPGNCKGLLGAAKILVGCSTRRQFLLRKVLYRTTRRDGVLWEEEKERRILDWGSLTWGVKEDGLSAAESEMQLVTRATVLTWRPLPLEGPNKQMDRGIIGFVRDHCNRLQSCLQCHRFQTRRSGGGLTRTAGSCLKLGGG